MLRFVILAVPRSGSNLLCTLLDSHPGVLCHHEVFNPQGVFLARSWQASADKELLAQTDLCQRDTEPFAFLEQVWESGHKHQAVGFKWTRGQNEVVLNHVVTNRTIRKIVLRRRNRVKTFVSEKIAQQTEQWEVYDSNELIQPRPQIRADQGELLQHVAANDTFYSELHASLRQTGQPFCDVDYEALFDADLHRQLLSFLEVKDTDVRLRASSVKQNSTDLRSMLANYEELSHALTDSELRAELLDCGM